jgi:rhamnose transport system permease protein
MPHRHRREISVALAIATLWIVVALRAATYFTRENLTDLAMANMPVLIVALGMTLVVLVAQIDISVGSVFAICSVAAGVFAKAGLPMPLTIVATVLVGTALGAVNGALVAYVRIPSIVVTLASMVALRDALRWSTQGAWVQGLPPNFQWFGFSLVTSQAITAAAALSLLAVFAWGLRNLAAGRSLYVTGSNSTAALLAGIDPALVTFSVFAILGALSGIAALLNSVRFNQIPANGGLGLEMKVIAAVVVGGAAVTGGRGTVAGTVLGVVLLGSIGPALTFLGISAYWEQAIQGAIILATVGLTATRKSQHA